MCLSLEPRWCRLQLHSKAVSKETVIEAAWGSLTFGDSAQFNFLHLSTILSYFTTFYHILLIFGVLSSSSTPIDTTFSLLGFCSPESPRRLAWLPRSRRWICDVPWDWPFRSLKIASRMFLGYIMCIIVHHFSNHSQHHNPFTTSESKRHQVNHAVPMQFLWRSYDVPLALAEAFRTPIESASPCSPSDPCLNLKLHTTDTHLSLKIWVY